MNSDLGGDREQLGCWTLFYIPYQKPYQKPYHKIIEDIENEVAEPSYEQDYVYIVDKSIYDQ